MKNSKWLNGNTVVIAICVLIFIGWKLFAPKLNTQAKGQIVKDHKKQSNMITAKLDSLTATVNALSRQVAEQTNKSNQIILLYTQENEILMNELLESKEVSQEVQDKITFIKKELNEITTSAPTDTFPIFK